MKRLLAFSGIYILITLALLVMSGTMLSLWYVPVGDSAYASVLAIAKHPVLSIVRNFHYWAANLLLILVVVHLTRVVFQQLATQKRLAYWSGIVLLIILASELLIGTFLRSDQEAYEAYAHFLVATGSIPFFGNPALTLTRFFVFHALLFPLSMILVMLFHAWKRFPPLRLWWRSGLVLLLLIINLAVIVPAPLWNTAYGGIEITQPPWYLLWVYGLENIGGTNLILIGPIVVFSLLILLPLLKRFNRVIFGLLISGLAALSIYALLVGSVSHLV